MVRKGLADLSTFVLANQREAANLGYAYPAQFSDHVFEGADGERIAATVGLQEGGGRPGLIVVHGLFSSRRFDYVRQIAVRAYYEWGFNVLALDLRSFGLTNLTSAAPTTVGWKEGEDIIAAGRYLKELGATTVGALGISLGAPRSSAPATRRAPPRRWTGASSRSPRPRTRGQWQSASRCGFPAPIRPTCSTSRSGRCSSPVSGRRGWEGIEDFVDPVERVSAPFYGVEPDELWSRAAAEEHIARGQGAGTRPAPRGRRRHPGRPRAGCWPTPRRTTELVRVWILPGGGHGAIDAVDRVWFYAVVRGFFERWAGYGSGDGAGDESRGPLAVQADLLRARGNGRGERHPQKTALDRARGRGRSALATVAREPGGGRDLGAGLRGGAAGVSADGPDDPEPPPDGQVGRRARLRRLRARLDPDPRGDRARQDGDPREGLQAPPGLGGRDRGRGVRAHGARDAHARHRLAAQRPVLLRTTSGSAS